MEKTNKSAPLSRSLILEMEDAKNNFTREVNIALKKGLPFYIVKDILEGLLYQVREGAKAELEAARVKEADCAKSTNEEDADKCH